MSEAAVRSINFGVVQAEAGCRLEHFVGIKLDESEIEDARAILQTKSKAVSVSGVAPQPGGIIVKIFVDSPRSLSENILIHVETGERCIQLRGIVSIGRQTGRTVTIYSQAGVRAKTEVPLDVELWKAVRYKAMLEPATKEFALSEGKGVVRGGAKVLPFDLLFTPARNTKTAHTAKTKLVLLLEDTGEMEWEVTGICRSAHELSHLASF
jgi:hypothetical protein